MGFERKEFKGYEKKFDDKKGFANRNGGNRGFGNRDGGNRGFGGRDKKPDGMSNGRIDNFEKPLLLLLKEISEKLDILIKDKQDTE
ncbi:hypothetical protein EELLY_v1c01300 [Entomoplasma ellychniae]|uniref:Uncharacterized protein n=1 Tax=Entomoplasma ellychniae TaxID=2114 RepID=A0A8E2UAJ1_9MOLU|nr:hypothetical protein [Entomoplasma ellychniae]PPE04455.1 hypothetical protein EELLY_v1c01300 [Entomoplasma ellychniae]